MPTPRVCQISDELFGGFQISVDIDYYYDTDEIATYVKNMLIGSLSKIHLGSLSHTAKNKNFHIHDKTIYNLRQAEQTEIIYICCHC